MTFRCSLNPPAHFENGILPGTRRRGAIIALAGSPQRRGLHSSTAASMKKRVWVYNGPGAGERSVESTLESLRGALQANVEVATLSSQALLADEWRPNCVALVMPGGADLPYCRILNGAGNAIIRRYVESGGAYIGLCAGAYYASSYVSFERTIPALAVEGPRELGFFPGSASSGIDGTFDYQSERGAHAAELILINDQSHDGSFRDYCNGGCAFLFTHQLDKQYPPEDEEKYVGVKVLARYGKGLVPHNGATDNALLEPYLSPGQAAAVACMVGEGTAVLCGTHPEMGPELLWALPDNEVDEAYAAHVVNLRTALETSDEQRWQFWLCLLRHAGLESWLRQGSRRGFKCF